MPLLQVRSWRFREVASQRCQEPTNQWTHSDTSIRLHRLRAQSCKRSPPPSYSLTADGSCKSCASDRPVTSSSWIHLLEQLIAQRHCTSLLWKDVKGTREWWSAVHGVRPGWSWAQDFCPPGSWCGLSSEHVDAFTNLEALHTPSLGVREA